MSKGFWGTRNEEKLAHGKLIMLLKMLGLTSANYDYFIHMDEHNTIRVLVKGVWVQLVTS